MGLNSLSAVILLALGGLSSATNFIPFRQIKRWSWEVYWPVQAFIAWMVAPTVLACILVPNCCAILRQAFQSDPRAVWLAFLFGIAWGVAAMTFGLAVRYLGIALGYATALGFSVFFGRLAPAFDGSQLALPPVDHAILLTLALTAVALALTAIAARRKEQEMTLEVKLEAGEQDYHFPRGLAMAALAGVMTLFLGLGLIAGRPVTALAQSALTSAGASPTWASLPILVVILAGGFLTNLVWSAILILRRESAKQFLGEPGVNPMRAVPTSGDTLVDFDPLDPSTYDRLAPSTLAANYLFAAAAGVLWFLQLIFYFMAVAAHTGQGSSSPTLLQTAFTLIFAALWGLAIHEWHGITARTRLFAALGLATLIAATLMH